MAASHTVTQFALARFGLGIGESGNFPAGVKTVADVVPGQGDAPSRSASSTPASNVGAILDAAARSGAMVPAIGWRMTFVLTGVFGVVWLVAWLAIYPPTSPPTTLGGPEELAYITQDPADPVGA